MTDYISRQAAFEALEKRGVSTTNISRVPIADVRENVRGEWRTTHLDHIAMGERPKILYCSVCNQCIAYPTNYCPNCGADMRGNNHD